MAHKIEVESRKAFHMMLIRGSKPLTIIIYDIANNILFIYILNK